MDESDGGLELGGGGGTDGAANDGDAGGGERLDGRRCRVGLARPGAADDRLDARARGTDGADHGGLLVAEVRLQREDRVDRRRGCGRRRRFTGPAQEPGLDLDQLRRTEGRGAAGANAAVVEPHDDLGVAPRGGAGEHDDAVRGEEPVGEPLDFDSGRGCADGGGDVADDVAPGEGGGALGQPERAGEVVVEPFDVGRRAMLHLGAAEARVDGAGVEAERGGAIAPCSGERVGVDGAVLRAAGGEGRLLAGARRRVAGLGEEVLDLVAPLAELVDHRLRDAGDVRHAFDHRSPLDAEAVAEQVAEVRLVEVAAGQRVVKQGPGIEAAPAVGDGEREVGDDDVGVQERVAGAAAAVVEGGGDEPGGLDPLAAVPGDDDLVLVVADDLVDRFPVRLPDGGPAVGVGERPQDADALRRAEGVVEARSPLGRLVLGGVGVDQRALHPPGGAGRAFGACLLALELAGAQEPADERGGDAELRGGLLGREPLVGGSGRDVAAFRAGWVDELLGGERVAAVEQDAEVFGVDLAVEARLSSEGADPAARRLTVSQVVVLGRGGDLPDVVLAAAGPELADAQHGTRPRSRRVRRRRNLQVFEGVAGVGDGAREWSRDWCRVALV